MMDKGAARLQASTPQQFFGKAAYPSADVLYLFAHSMRAAMGLPIPREVSERLVHIMDDLNRRVPSYRPDHVAYLLFVSTRDSVFAPRLKRWAPSSVYPAIEARLALLRGDSATARRIVRAFPSPDSLRRSLFSMNGARVIARADLLWELGATQQAAETYEAVEISRFAQRNGFEPGWAYFMRSYLARGQLYDQLGNHAKAIAAYEQFIGLWTNAEAPLQPQLREASTALARLKDKARPAAVVPRARP